MCIKKNKKILYFETTTDLLCEQLSRNAIPGDTIVFHRVTHKAWTLYFKKDVILDFGPMGLLEVPLKNAVGSSIMATMYRCCDDWDCQCRHQATLKAQDALNGSNPRFQSGSYELLTNNGETFCYFCIHGIPYTSRGLKTRNYFVLPVTFGSGAAMAGAGVGLALGLLGGPIAPVTVPAGMGFGAIIGGGTGVIFSLIGGKILQISRYSQLKYYCSNSGHQSTSAM